MCSTYAFLAVRAEVRAEGIGESLDQQTIGCATRSHITKKHTAYSRDRNEKAEEVAFNSRSKKKVQKRNVAEKRYEREEMEGKLKRTQRNLYELKKKVKVM